MDKASFSGSNGLLDLWKKHYGVKASILSGEAADVGQEDEHMTSKCMHTAYSTCKLKEKLYTK